MEAVAASYRSLCLSLAVKRSEEAELKAAEAALLERRPVAAARARLLSMGTLAASDQIDAPQWRYLMFLQGPRRFCARLLRRFQRSRSR